jgi:hypothetical protein
MAARGWSSAGLRSLGDTPEAWTAQEASAILGPPVLSCQQLRALIRAASLEPVGKRKVTRHGVSGRYARCYRALDLIRLYDAMEQLTGREPE